MSGVYGPNCYTCFFEKDNPRWDLEKCPECGHRYHKTSREDKEDEEESDCGSN